MARPCHQHPQNTANTSQRHPTLQWDMYQSNETLFGFSHSSTGHCLKHTISSDLCEIYSKETTLVKGVVSSSTICELSLRYSSPVILCSGVLLIPSAMENSELSIISLLLLQCCTLLMSADCWGCTS